MFILREEMFEFLQHANHETYSKFEDIDFLLSLAFLVDVFEFINIINLSLQGKGTTILHSHSKIKSLKMKLKLWVTKLENYNFACFSTLNTYIDETNAVVTSNVISIMKQHLEMLIVEFDKYFPNLDEFELQYKFVHFPFSTNVLHLPYDDFNIQEQFIDMINNEEAKHIFNELSCADFWIKMSNLYPDIAKASLRLIMPFPTTYECETAFSALLTIKSKHRNRLDIGNDMRVALCKTQPNIEELVSFKQIHPSH